MNKNPWLIAGIAASGAVMVASFVTAFPETVKRKESSGSSSRSRSYRSGSSSDPSFGSRAWNGVTDTFGLFAANTVAVASAVSDTVCDTARDTYSSVTDHVSSSTAGSSYSSPPSSGGSDSGSYSGGSDSGSSF